MDQQEKQVYVVANEAKYNTPQSDSLCHKFKGTACYMGQGQYGFMVSADAVPEMIEYLTEKDIFTSSETGKGGSLKLHIDFSKRAVAPSEKCEIEPALMVPVIEVSGKQGGQGGQGGSAAGGSSSVENKVKSTVLGVGSPAIASVATRCGDVIRGTSLTLSVGTPVFGIGGGVGQTTRETTMPELEKCIATEYLLAPDTETRCLDLEAHSEIFAAYQQENTKARPSALVTAYERRKKGPDISHDPK